MTRAARSARSAMQQAEAAADRLLDWLSRQGGTARTQADRAPEPTEHNARSGRAPADVLPPPPAQAAADTRPDRARAAAAGAPLRLPHPDWLHHRMVVTGATEVVADFQTNARGPGTIPWTLDFGRLEEDLFHLLVTPPAPQRRRMSVAGARVLAGQLREAVALRHHAAASRVGRSRACPFDLHALVPVPADILRLGPDHPDALAWLWTFWGTTDALRHVTTAPVPALRTTLPAGITTVQLMFWSADWTPWRALAAVAARWPTLRFDVCPTYGVL